MLSKDDLKQIGKLIGTVATKTDLKPLATKEELKNIATKDELKNLATKDDLKTFATKEDLKNLATKDELKNLATKDELKMLASKDDLKSVKEDVSHIRKDMKTIINFFNREYLGLRKRVERIEEILKLPPLH